MPATLVVDQAARFNAVILLSCAPKLFGGDQQDKTREVCRSGSRRCSVAAPAMRSCAQPVFHTRRAAAASRSIRLRSEGGTTTGSTGTHGRLRSVGRRPIRGVAAGNHTPHGRRYSSGRPHPVIATAHKSQRKPLPRSSHAVGGERSSAAISDQGAQHFVARRWCRSPGRCCRSSHRALQWSPCTGSLAIPPT